MTINNGFIFECTSLRDYKPFTELCTTNITSVIKFIDDFFPTDSKYTWDSITVWKDDDVYCEFNNVVDKQEDIETHRINYKYSVLLEIGNGIIDSKVYTKPTEVATFICQNLIELSKGD